ncbi:biotin/lipoyl-binding protein [Methylobacterium nodulans]|uniref:HlyD family efflux transporter periplasmic adaptor subunit n=1 Tax=Methylobacterium nodulans TaxID=114616 RepID=UPI000A05A6DD|nr:biotin/lipoyl-binding protein [Methylobacterium nodulans]
MALTIKNKIDIGPGQAWANVCWVFIFAAMGLAIFPLSASFSRREQVSSFLTADPQIVRIDAPRPGRIQRIAVREGQGVKRGEILISVDPDPVLVSGKPAAQAELERLKVTEQELQNRVQSIGSQITLKGEELADRIDAVTDAR